MKMPCFVRYLAVVLLLSASVWACSNGDSGQEKPVELDVCVGGECSGADARDEDTDTHGDDADTRDDEPCGDAVCGDGLVCNRDTLGCEVDAPEQCAQGTLWEPGEAAFRDASSDWGLDDSGANGQRLSVTDVDGDGWADLSVRRAGADADDFTDGGERASWLLRNTGADADARRFEDITRASGLVATRGGDADRGRPVDIVIWGDVDNDGDLDAYTAFNKQQTGGVDEDSAEIMLNQGDGTFVHGPADSLARSVGEIDSAAGASFVDVDRDGRLDLWVSRYAEGRSPQADRLLIGAGDAHFDDVTDAWGLTTKPWINVGILNRAEGHSQSWGAAACDLNGDGTPELMASSYGRAPNHLWLGERAADGTVAYTNRSIESGYAFDHRTDWSDNESARCYCMHNPQAEDCQGVPEPELIACPDDEGLRWNHDTDREPFRLGGNTGSTVCADVDNDGWLDLLTTEIVHWDVGSTSDPSELLFNEADEQVSFARPGNEATGLTRTHDGVTWDDGDITAAVFDFDNDGRLDVYIGSTDYPGTRGHLWHQKDDGSFEKVELADGIDHTSSHGVAVADFNRDGALDIAVGHSRFRCGSGDHCYPPEQAHVRLFENVVGQQGNFIQLALEGGQGTNRAAIGARVRVETDGLTQVAEVGGGHGHYGIQHDLTQHFGLADACRATVTVTWPDEDLTEETFVMRAGHRYIWRQGQVPRVADP
jgi:enediyne biosynthesis protein E4